MTQPTAGASAAGRRVRNARARASSYLRPDEIFVVLQGTGVVTAGELQREASAGAIAVAPAFAKHGWENTGAETLKLVGFFGANVLINEFAEPVAPFGLARFVTPVGN